MKALGNKMMLSGWVEPIATVEDYRLAKEVGLTHLFIGDSVFGIDRNSDEFVKLLDICGRAGIKAVIRTMNSYPYQDKHDYSRYKSVAGINYWDEPFEKDFDKVARLADYHIKTYGDRLDFFINLAPNETTDYWQPWDKSSSHRQYVEKFCAEVLSKITKGKKILSCDVYPFVGKKSGERRIKSTWLPCVENIAVNARKYGAESHFFIQSAEFGNAGDYTNQSDIHLQVDEKELSLQVFAEMAFGIRGFTYFTYADYGGEGIEGLYTKGLVSNKVSQKKNPLYDGAKKLNYDIKAFEDIFLSFNWFGTMALKGENGGNANFEGLTGTLKSIPFIKSISASQDTLIGSFKNNNGGNALMVTNFSDPAKNLSDSMEIEFNGASGVTAYRGGEEKAIILKNNTLTLEIPAGQGTFLVIK